MRRDFRRVTAWETLVFAVCGALFPLPYMLEAPWFELPELGIVIAVVLLPVVILTIARRWMGIGYWFFLIMFLACLAQITWHLRLTLEEQFWLVNDRFLGLEEPATVPEASILAGFFLVLWSCAIMILEECLAGHFLLCLCVLGVMLLMPMIGVHPGIKAMILPTLFGVGFFWIHDQKHHVGVKNAIHVSAPRKKIHIISLMTVGLTSAAFAAGILLATRAQDPLYQAVFDVESRVDTFLDRYRSSIGAGTLEKGSISRSNCYPSDQEYLQVYVDHEPQQDIYLREFVGGSYNDGVWSPVDETDLYKDISKRYGWEESGTRLENMFENMYFMQNQKTSKDKEKNILAVKRLNGSNVPITPYFSRKETTFLNEHGEERSFGQNTSVFWYYELKDLYQELAYDESSSYSQLGLSFRTVENLYGKAVQERYIEVPENLTRMQALVEENPKTELQEITTFILFTLKTKTTYSLTPGFVPVNADVSEYFLFESGKGYCEHYASAAALLYRLYGIPARYATGYRIPADTFTYSINGYWVSRATGKQSHAWVEIFLKDYGWVPVDVTPGEENVVRANYPGYERATLETMLEEDLKEREREVRMEEIILPDIEQYQHDLPDQTQSPERPDLPEKPTRKIARKSLLTILAVLLIPALLEGLRFLRLWLRKKKNCRQLFGKLTNMLYVAGMEKKPEETEEDIAARAERFIPKADMMEAYRIAEQEAFGNRPATDEEKACLLHVIYLVAEKIRADNLWPKRLWYRWGKAYW